MKTYQNIFNIRYYDMRKLYVLGDATFWNKEKPVCNVLCFIPMLLCVCMILHYSGVSLKKFYSDNLQGLFHEMDLAFDDENDKF